MHNVIRTRLYARIFGKFDANLYESEPNFASVVTFAPNGCLQIMDTDNEVELRNAVENFRQNLRHSINAKNLNKFITSYMQWVCSIWHVIGPLY